MSNEVRIIMFDEYTSETTVSPVINQKVVLDFLPDEFTRISISGFYETTNKNDIKLNQFYCDYNIGMCHFNPENNGETITASYMARGIILYPASRIYIHNDNPDIVETIEKLVNDVSDAKSAYDAATKANLSVEVTNARGTFATLPDRLAGVDEHLADGTSHAKTARFVIGTSTAGWTAADCDYLCDGTADQTEINAAITALPATGGEIVILDGTYNISTRIIISKNNVSVRGNCDSTVLKRGWNASTINEYSPIVFCGKNNCLISNLAIDGNKGTYTASYNTNISIEGSNNILTNISANNCASNSVVVNGSFNKITCNKVIGNPNNSGIHLAGDFNIVCGNECRDNYSQINLNGANNNIITSNICIKGTGLPSDYGSSNKTINLFESTSNYNLIAMNNCMGKAVTVGGGTGNTLVNNKFDAA